MPRCPWGQKTLPDPLLSSSNWKKLSSEAHYLKVGRCSFLVTHRVLLPAPAKHMGSQDEVQPWKYLSGTVQKDTYRQKGHISSLESWSRLCHHTGPSRDTPHCPLLPPVPSLPSHQGQLQTLQPFRKSWFCFWPPLTIREHDQTWEGSLMPSGKWEGILHKAAESPITLSQLLLLGQEEGGG